MPITRLLISAQSKAEFEVYLPARETAAENQRTDASAVRIIELYDELRLPVLRYLICLGMRSNEAEEIVQESFLRAFQQLRLRSDRGQILRAWIFRVAHNLAINELKKHNHLSGIGLCTTQMVHSILDQAPTVEEQLLEKEKILRLRAAIAKLSARQRQCLYLRAEGLRYREIAQIMGISITTIADSLRLAYETLSK
jgi:RNA polymerase sigma-70 factor (ECF subfamily)